MIMQNATTKRYLINSNFHLRQFLSVSKYVLSHIKIKGKTLDNWLFFYLSEPRVLAEAAFCKSCFALTLISQNRYFYMWRDMLKKHLSLKYSESILAFQLHFGTYEAESEHFR